MKAKLPVTFLFSVFFVLTWPAFVHGDEPYFLQGLVPPPCWSIWPTDPTTEDVIYFEGPLDRIYSNSCYATLAAGAFPEITVTEDSVEIGRGAPPPEVCTAVFDPVCGIAGEFGPLTQGDWVFESSYPITLPCYIEFHVGPGLPLTLNIDIRPTSCPNPLNLDSRGVLPVAVLGSEGFEVDTIDTASVRLAGASPIRSSYEDVAPPPSDSSDCQCTTEGPDGYIDLNLKFKTEQIVELLLSTHPQLVDGDVLVLTLTGVLNDATPVEGADCVTVVGRVPKPLAAKRSDINGDGIVNILDLSMLAEYWLEAALLQD